MMNARRLTVWDIAYVVLLILAIPVLIDHLASGRYGQVAMTVLFLAVGLVILAYSWRHGGALGPEMMLVQRPAPRPTRKSAPPARTASGRLVNWVTQSTIAGFAATAVMTVGLLIGFGAARVLGSEAAGASQFERWLWALTHNPLTETTEVNLPVALVLHFLAGIAWAIIYAAFVEPRLDAPGWRKGLIFALVPWLLSLVVFLPIAGGGLFGAELDAGPLPAIGNLLLHLAYGATLGAAYTSQRVLVEEGRTVDEAERRALAHSERDIALGVLPGMVIGGLAGLLGAGIFAPGQDPWLVAVFGAIAGSAVGVLIGSFVGLSPASE